MSNRCYITSIAQVSCQKPLSEQWLSEPIWYNLEYARAIEPDSKEFILPSEARRMSRILKRTVCTAIFALNHSGIKQPDAIITGTGMGCMENSEKFLIDICRFGENCLKPTLFMQSTHNTISSLIAIILKCHGYNNTYSHRGISFDSALLDAWLQMKAGTIRNALVGSHDEVTPLMALVQQRTRPDYRLISESSVSAVLSSTTAHSTHAPLCEVESVEILYRPTPDELANAINPTYGTALLTGINGCDLNDRHYRDLLELLNPDSGVLQYKNLFGENDSSSAMAFYVGAILLSHHKIPEFMNVPGYSSYEAPSGITIINHSEDSAWSIVKLKQI